MNALGGYMSKRWLVRCSSCNMVAYSYHEDKEAAVEDLTGRGWRETPIRLSSFIGIGPACPTCAPVHHEIYEARQRAGASIGDSVGAAEGSIPT